MATLLIGLLAMGPARGQAPVSLDLALVLAMDCSYSVDQSEYDLQIAGLASAFRNPRVIAAIAAGPEKRIGVTLVQWADSVTQVTVIPWRILGGERSIRSFANDIYQMPRLAAGGATSISGVMRFGHWLLKRLPFTARRMAIDIVADGRNNSGGGPRPVRDWLSSHGITINGLTIMNEVETLDLYFRQNVVGGPGHFVVKAQNYRQFDVAILSKLLREIIGPGIAARPGSAHQWAHLGRMPN